MLNFIITAGIAIVATVGSLFGVYNYLPLSILETSPSNKNLGSSITTILGTDTLKDSRAVINTNFSNLNTDKIEATVTTLGSLTSASALNTIGTIISGIWNGTVIGVGYGGTGTTSPTLNQVILGNTTSGFKVVSGLGSSGEFLTSQGAGTPPIWSALNQTATYVWTGLHSFGNTGTTTFSGGIESGTKIAAPYFIATSTTATSTFNGGVSGISNYQSFTSSGTWTKPSGLTGNEIVTVQVWGAGGAGGGGGSGGTHQAGGGGGGGYSEEKYRASDLGATETVTIGAGGTGVSGSNGNIGGNSTFGSLVTAFGGAGGVGNIANGDGGVGGNSEIGMGAGVYAGGVGATGDTQGNVGARSTYGGGGGGEGSSATAGAGGAAFFGGAGGGGGGTTAGAGGAAKIGYGGVGGTGSTGVGNGSAATGLAGGGGGGVTAGGTATTGGVGYRGEVRVWIHK